MKKRINLLYSRKNYAQIRNLVKYFRLFTYFLGLVTIVALSSVFALKSLMKTKYDLAAGKKQELLKESIRNKDLEHDALFMNDKSIAFNEYLSQDVNFLPYYRILRNYLPVSTSSASINLIGYDNKRNTSFTIEFSAYEDFIGFIENVEDEKFLSIFEKLQLESFSISEKKAANYRLRLVGKFKPTDEITN